MRTPKFKPTPENPSITVGGTAVSICCPECVVSYRIIIEPDYPGQTLPSEVELNVCPVCSAKLHFTVDDVEAHNEY